MKRFTTLFFLLAISAFEAQAQVAFVFNCTRTEKDYTENYELRIQPATKVQKAKVFLDGRDLDRMDEGGRQTVRTVVIARPNILITIEASFDPELIDGITYPAGKVATEISLNQVTGKLIKAETIQGGILGVHLGNGRKTTEEHCVPLLGENH
ncbi:MULTISPECIES: hypothetical protein [unclassified Polynucleobacter]|uniref:hypothetical protein n=1 Tax=unclassified Polynucleobacter TaxID=2640945 RepID=UPI0025D15A27|nr:MULTISPECIES: hypothetical protein [unclassified Polynucleobacter]